MEPWLIAIIVISSLFVAACLFLFVVAALSENSVFGKRADKNPLLKYFSASDFNLNAKGFSLGKLYGLIYENKFVTPKNEVIIFVHGMGAGHCAYTTEIAYFCNLGYTVVAVDSLGCGLSQGKNLKGMYQGVKTVISTVNFVKQRINCKKIYLVGHSWGGYSALCASAKVKADKIIAISAPDSPAKTMASGAAPLIGKPLATILRPFWRAVNFFKFGLKGNACAGKSASKNGTPTLIIHGGRDNTVTLNCSAYKTAKGAHITKHLAKDKAHNPYNTVKAEEKLKELSKTLASKTLTAEEKQKFFSNFDFKAATEQDPEVMQIMARFLSA